MKDHRILFYLSGRRQISGGGISITLILMISIIPSHTSRLMSWFSKYQLKYKLATALDLLWSMITLPNVETADSSVILDFFHVPETLEYY